MSTVRFRPWAPSRYKIFPHDRAAIKVVYITVEHVAKNWTMSLHDWNLAINQFMIYFSERLPSTF